MAIAFTAMNKPIKTDAADMPHVLGDPVDVAWQGMAERSNANLTAVETYAATVSAAVNVAPSLTGTDVLAPAAEYTLTNGYANARTTTFFAGLKAVHLDIRLYFNATGFYRSDSLGRGWYRNGTGTMLTNITLGTLVAALKPATALRIAGQIVTSSAANPTQAMVDITLSTAGVLGMARCSNVVGEIEQPGYTQFGFCYLTA